MTLSEDVERLREALCLEEGPIAATLKEACKQLGVEEEGTLPARADSCLEAVFGVIGVSDQNTGPGNGSVEQPQATAEGGSDRDGGIVSLGTKRSRPTAAVAVNHLSEKRSRLESGAATDDGAPAAHDGTSAQALVPAAPLALADRWDNIQEEDDALVPEHARESPASNLL
jgi:hypothetical protein